MSWIRTRLGWRKLRPRRNSIAASNDHGRYDGPLPTKAAEDYGVAIQEYLVNKITYRDLLVRMAAKVPFHKEESQYSLNPWDARYDRDLDPRYKEARRAPQLLQHR